MTDKQTDEENQDEAVTAYLCPRCGAYARYEIEGQPGIWGCDEKKGGCAQKDRLAFLGIYKWTGSKPPRDKDHSSSDKWTFHDLVVTSKTLSRLSYAVGKSLKPKDAFDEYCDEATIPREYRKLLSEKLHDYRKPLGDVMMESGVYVKDQEDYVTVVKEFKQGGEHTIRVIHKPFKVVRRVEIEGELRAVVELDGGNYAGTADDIYNRLKSQGKILNSRTARDVIGALISASPNHTKGYPTYAVYEEDGYLLVPDEILPSNEVQEQVVSRLLPHLDVEPSAEDWERYARMFSKYHTHEWAPAAALAALTPFSQVLKARGILIPHVYHLSRRQTTGKTKLAFTCTEKAWSVPLVNCESIESDFRFGAYLDAVALPKTIDEAQSFDWEKFSGHLKQSAETELSSGRGQITNGGVSMMHRRNRGAFVFTSNHLQQLSASVLKRFLIVLFDDSRKITAELQDEFEDDIDALNVVGPALVRAALKRCDADADTLIHQIKKEILPVMRSEGGQFMDASRPKMWAAIYWSLQAWGDASDGAVPVPKLDEFIRLVVKPVEDSTRASILDPLAALQSWLARQWARAMRPDGTTQGMDGLMADGDVDGLDGWWISKPMLDAYNEDRNRGLETKFSGLKELVPMIEQKYRIAASEQLDDSGKPQTRRVGTKTPRVVFVPEPDAAGPDPQAELEDEDSGDDEVGGRRRQIVEVVRDLSQDDERGARLGEVLAAVEARGVDRGVAQVDLDVLRQRGTVYEPVLGRLKAL